VHKEQLRLSDQCDREAFLVGWVGGHSEFFCSEPLYKREHENRPHKRYKVHPKLAHGTLASEKKKIYFYPVLKHQG
jgi:hypothetical protein